MRWEISKVPAGYFFWARPSGFQPGVSQGDYIYIYILFFFPIICPSIQGHPLLMENSPGFMMMMNCAWAAVVTMVGAAVFLIRGPHWKVLRSFPVVIMPSTARYQRLLARVALRPIHHWSRTGNCLMKSWATQSLRIVVPAPCHWNIRA